MIWLPFRHSFVNPFDRTHVASAISSKVEIPKGSSQSHSNSLATAPNGQVDQHRVKGIEITCYFSTLSIATLPIAFSPRKNLVEEVNGNPIEERNDYFAE